MIIFKAYKFRVYPNSKQKQLINKSFGCSRFTYNYYLNKKKNNYKLNKNNLTLKDIKHDLVLLKDEFPWLKEVDSMCLTNALEDLDIAYTNFFNNGGYPKFKKKGIKDSYKTDMIKRLYNNKEYYNIEVNIKERLIKLPKLGYMKIRGYRNLKEFDKDIKNVTISKEADKYYVSVCTCENIVEHPFKLLNVIGIDLGVKDLVITSDGVKYKKLNTKRVEKHIEDVQRRLSRCEKGSIRRYKLKLKIKRLYIKLKNMRKYYIHKITKELTDENDMIITENLNVKNMISKEKRTSKYISKYIANSSLSEIIRVLNYKMKWKGKKILAVNTYFPSSQICNRCGQKNTKLKDLSIRKWECDKCGYIHDRDINSSLNLLYKGIEIYFKEMYRQA